jgi:phage tail-like protein
MVRIIRPYDYLLDANAGWRAGELRDTSVDSRWIELRRLTDTLPPLADPRGTFRGRGLPRGVAVWNNPNQPANPQIFIADPDKGHILWWRLCCGLLPIPSLGGRLAASPVVPPVDDCSAIANADTYTNPRRLSRPTGLTIRSNRDLIVVDAGSRRVLIFTLPGFALRQVLTFDSWQPIDAVALNRWLFILDANPTAPRVWKLDAQGRPHPYYPGAIPNSLTPQRIQVDGEGRAYIVGEQAGEQVISALDPYGMPSTDPVAEQVIERLPATPLSADDTGRVLLAMPGKCPRPPIVTDITVDASGYLLGTQLYVLHRPPETVFASVGVFATEPLDSGRMGNSWHRVVLELDIPDRTAVNLYSHTSDVPRADLSTAGLLEDPPRLGGWQAAPDNTDEWLIQSAPGRYLVLALVLKGTGEATPRVERLYLYQRRESSLRFLPAVFQEDEISRGLLDRLLSLFDTLYGEIEDQIEDFPLLLDVMGAPDEFLPWLASWFSLTLEPSWTSAQRRAILKEVVTLFAQRGTINGLRRLIQLHANLSDPHPRIIEHFRGTTAAADDELKRWLGTVPDAANHFTIVLPARAVDSEVKRTALRRLIDANKPAHTHYTLRPVFASGGMWLGGGRGRASALGIDTQIAGTRVWRLPDEAAEPQPLPELGMVLPDDAVPAARLGQAKLNRAQMRRK